MNIKNKIIKKILKGKNSFIKAATKTEEKFHFLDRSIRDVLDEIGDCLHDDHAFRRKMVNEVCLRPKMKKIIAFKFLCFIIQIKALPLI